MSEPDFTHCNGRTSRGNRRRDVCESASLFFEDPSACYLRRPRRKRRYRRYWDTFALEHGSVRGAFPGADLQWPCPFSESMQQPMRNLAIAMGLEQDRDGTIEKAWFALCVHDANTDVAGHWERWRSLLPDPSMAPVILRPMSWVLARIRGWSIGRPGCEVAIVCNPHSRRGGYP